ncbi:hypothetical protein JCM10450v2_001201 [Rhodotorula kratochvilovae]
MSTAPVRAAWHRAAQAWPRDPFRPERQFQDAIVAAADRALAPAAQLSPVQVNKAEEAAAALTRLVENRALKAHPMGDRTTKPASFPKHYARIQDSVERAQRGEVFKPSGLARWFNFRWK